MDPTWILSAPDGPHVGPMNLAIRDTMAIERYGNNFTSVFLKDIFFNIHFRNLYVEDFLTIWYQLSAIETYLW